MVLLLPFENGGDIWSNSVTRSRQQNKVKPLEPSPFAACPIIPPLTLASQLSKLYSLNFPLETCSF